MFSSLASKSEAEIEKEIRRCDETRVKSLYLQVLIKIEKAVSGHDIQNLKKGDKVIAVLNETQNKIALKSYYESKENPISGTNLIILACKQNAVNVLEYILSNESKILDNLSTAIEISIALPSSQDDECHDSFYYAIHSNNVKLLETLMTKWPDNYFDSHLDELDEIISKAYEEIKLKNMLLSDEMELFVESRLIDLRFFSKDSGNVKCAKSSLNNIKERIGLVLENINMLTAEYSDIKEIDGKFLVAAKFIARNIHILKRQLKPTYNRVPWEEMEFCLTVFVRSKITDHDFNLMCNFILPKKRILMHLENFAVKLNEIKISEVDVNKKIPSAKRETIVSTIIKDYPPFGELYEDYTKVADLNSLDKISSYLDLALMANPEQEQDRLVIVKALQVTGEYLKNTLESPKLSMTTSELLLLSAPKNIREILTDLRNSLAHALPFSKGMKMEEKFSINVQNDLKKIGTIVTDILFRNKIKTCRIILRSIIASENLKEIRQLAEGFSSFRLTKPVLGNFEAPENKKIKDLVEKLSFIVYEKTEYEKSLFKKIDDIFVAEENISVNENVDYVMAIAMLEGIKIQLRSCKFDQNGVRVIKSCAVTVLETLCPKMKPSSLKQIVEIVVEIADLLKPRLESECVNEVNRIVLQIFHVTHYELDNIEWIEQLQEKVTKNKFAKFCRSTESGQKKNTGIHQENWKNQLSQKLSMLESILNDNALNGPIIENYLSYKSDRKLQTTIEMLVQDVMSILESSSMCLTDNLLFLDDNSPLLNGRSLRNHLAHGNALVEVLLFDPAIAIISNARKLVSEDVINNKKYIGKLVKDSPLHQRKKHKLNLQAVINQEAMFTALEEGNFEDLKSYVKKGSDINARSIKKSWTALHFAAKGPSLEVVKFVFSQSTIATDVDGQNPLHVAATYGQTCNVEFFVSQKGFNINDVDNYCQTPLHLAAQNGHRGVVEALLKRGASTTKNDILGRLPIHYAVVNNYKDITVILLQKERNSSICESMGGYSLLHIAAENGHLEILHFLLQTKEDVNVKTDRNWTPLHAAALNGHFEVVKTLISYGANINAKLLTDSCTPLHYAIENGHEKIVEILLKHGANVNAADKVYNNVPLHYAAQSGYGKIVEILLENKADVNICTANGMTSLHFAAYNGYEEIVELLLKHKASIDIKDNHGNTALHFSDNKTIAELLIKNRASVHSTDDDARTPLHYASLCGNKEVVELLIAEKSVIDSQDLQGYTELHLCSMSGNADIMDVLIKNGANTNAEDYDGNTALHFISAACLKEITTEFIFKHVRESIFKPKNGGQEMKKMLQADDTDFSVRNKTRKDGKTIKLLLDNNANVNAKCKGNITPLHLAALNGNVQVLEALIEGKANVNIRDVNGCTPLHMATLGNHKKVIDILIRNGADVNSTIDIGHSPLFLAIKYNYKEIVKLLIRKGADVNTKGGLLCAIFGGFKDIAEMLLKNKKMNIASRNETLHVATGRGLKGIVEALIAKGADVNAATDGDLRPLHIAAQKGHKDVVELLLAKGANVNSKCLDGTPLHLAAPQGHDDIVKILLRNRANVHIKDIKDRTALGLAVAHGRLQVVRILLNYMDVNRTMEGVDRWPVLHVASPEGDLEMIKCLIDAGADIHAKNTVGTQAIHLAAREGHKDVVEFFLSRGCNIDDLGVAHSTLLHYATMGCQLEMAKYLINLNIDVNATNCYNSRPLHIAASLDSEDVVRLLLSNGAIYDAVNEFDQKPLDRAKTESIITLLASTEKLFKAVRCANTSEIENHVKTGAFINAKNHQHIMPLHFAAWKGHEEVVRVLLKHQANPNAIGKGGCTPLHYAAKFGHLRIVKSLLSSGAVYNTLSDNFKMPLDFSEDQAIIDLLKLVARFFEKIQNGDPGVVDDFKQVKDINTLKVVMNACNKENKTLMVAAVHNDFPKIEKLKEVVLGDEYMAIGMANHLLSQEKYGDALNIFHNVHKRMENILGSENPCTLDIQNHIAIAVYAEKKYLEALPLYQEIYEKRKKILGPNNRDTLSTRSTVALVLFRLGKIETALEIFQEICKKQKEILGENDRDTLDSQFHMALALANAKKFEEALSINYEVFNKRKQIFGINHLLTLAAQNNIAMVLSCQGKCEEAIKIYKQVYEKRKKILGPFHSGSLKVLNNIAEVYLQEEKYDAALKAYHEVFDLQRKNLGSDCLDTWYTKYNIGNIYFKQGKWVQALKVYKEGLHRGKVILGSEHPFILDILSKLKVINLRFKFDNYDDSSDVFKYIQKDIFIAADNGDAKSIQELLDEGIDVNAKDAEGRTPLHFAANSGHKSIVCILLKNGADASIASDKGNTPLHTATSRGHQEIVEMLLQHVEQENLNKLNNLVNAQTTGSGSTSLHIACKNGSFDIVKCLLKYGAAYNCRDKRNNKTPLDYSENQNITNLLHAVDDSFESENTEIIRKLEKMPRDEFQAIVNAHNNEGEKVQFVINNPRKNEQVPR